MATVDAEIAGPVTLARAMPFSLGDLHVTPALRQVSRGEESRSLEPRVMQVLVALAAARGGIVSRDELIDRCWDGRIVGDNSINRVISLLRQLSEGMGKDCFEIETVVKVGYRLLRPAAPAAPVAQSPADEGSREFSRRRLMIGGVALGAIGIVAGTLLTRDSQRRTVARRLYQSGIELQRQGDPERIGQVIDYFRRAVRADPSFAEAWGALAHALAHNVDELPPPTAARFSTEAGDAATRALALDPGNRDATLARLSLRPLYRNWAAIEREAVAATRRFPDGPMLAEIRIRILSQTGRWREAVTAARALTTAEPFDVRHQLLLGRAYWGMGEVEWARATLDRAARQPPQNDWLWLARLNLYALGGAPRDALALIETESRDVMTALPLQADLARLCALALLTRAPGDIDRAIAALVDQRRSGRVASFVSIPYLAALGAVDIAFAQCDDYFLGKLDPAIGRRTPPPTHQCWTDFLFLPPTATLRADPRFGTLMQATGLDAYWRETGTQPDYRNRA